MFKADAVTAQARVVFGCDQVQGSDELGVAVGSGAVSPFDVSAGLVEGSRDEVVAVIKRQYRRAEIQWIEDLLVDVGSVEGSAGGSGSSASVVTISCKPRSYNEILAYLSATSQVGQARGSR